MDFKSKRYEIRFEGRKTVSKYNSKERKWSTPENIDEWSDVVEMSSRPTLSNMLAPFTSFLYPKSGITVHHLMHVPHHPGCFVAQQTENSKGYWDKNGKYIGTYYVEVSYRVVEPMVPFDTSMNLPASEIEWES